MFNKTKLWLSVFPLIIVNNFIATPAKATSNDAITLESIRAVSTTVLTGENIVMELEVAVPTGYSWDPNVTALGGKISVLLCPTSRFSEVSGIGTCTFSGTSSTNYTLSNIGSVSSSTVGLFDIKTFNISGTINSGEINTYKLFRVRIPAGNIPDRSELHTYLRGQIFAQELGSDRTDIAVPTFLNGDVSVVAPTPTPTPTPTVSETVTPSPTPTPSATDTSTPVSESGGTSNVVNRIINSVLQPIGIQASGQSLKKTPNKNGDLTWKKSREIVTNNEEWSVKKNRKASGGSFISTSVNESKIQLITRGDAFTLRFMTGKKMGKIQVNVDGKKLAVINTRTNSTKSKAKSWIGIGTGNHKIEIIPILDLGQSIGIDAYQVARAV